MNPGEAEFPGGIVSGERGDEVDIPVSLGEYDELYLVVGDEEEVNFELGATVSDGSGDYNVTVVFDTDAGESDAAWLGAADGSDSVSVANEANPYDVGTLDAGTYDMTLYETATTDAPIDEGVVQLGASSE